MKKSEKVLLSALGFSAMMAVGSAEAMSPPWAKKGDKLEKCMGVAAKGKNDCGVSACFTVSFVVGGRRIIPNYGFINHNLKTITPLLASSFGRVPCKSILHSLNLLLMSSNIPSLPHARSWSADPPSEINDLTPNLSEIHVSQINSLKCNQDAYKNVKSDLQNL